MHKRIWLDVLAFISIFVLPWWCTALLVLCIIVFFKSPYEAVALALVADLLYSMPETRFFGFMFVGTVATALALLLKVFLQTRLRFTTH